MKQMSTIDAMKLVKSHPNPAISLFIETSQRNSDSHAKISTNIQHLLKKVETWLLRTYGAGRKEKLLNPLRRALATLRLSSGKGGVGIFHSESFTGVVRLPTLSKSLAVAASSFHVKPILRCMQLRKAYYLLALRKKQAELYYVNNEGAHLLERIAHYTEEKKTSPQFITPKDIFRSRMKVRKQKQIRLAMDHLHKQIQSYFSAETAPLLLVGEHRYQQAFRQNCYYRGLLEHGIANFAAIDDKNAMMQQANDFMEAYFSRQDIAAIKCFYKAKTAGLASSNLAEIGLAASEGRVQSLLVADDRHIWGHFDRQTGRVQLVGEKADAVSDDVLDDLAEAVLIKSGSVTVLPSSQMPDGLPIAAVFRWQHGGNVALFKGEHMIPLDRQKPPALRIEAVAR